ncbi:MAG: hypothetical protein LBV12_02260 [Puniceicoccales bacterium]|nr:hypothetical protein [Puniceicoccales bacterium]
MSPLSPTLLVTGFVLTVPFSAWGNAVSSSEEDSAAKIQQLNQELLEQRQRLDQLQQQLASLAKPPHSGESAPSAIETSSMGKTTPWSPASPITIARSGGTYLNISLVGDIAVGASTKDNVGTVQMGGHDPSQRGFTIQGIEATFEGAVDNYFRALANVVYGLNTEGDSYFELEEAYAETLCLPYGLQLRAGQYFTEFGRINVQHPHSWDFIDAPIVTARFLGPDGLRNPGARLSWLMPTPFYSEAFFGVQNSQGETAYSFRNDYDDDSSHGHAHAEDFPFGRPSVETSVHGLKDMLYTGRYAASFDLSDSQTILGGISGAWGPNSTGDGARTQIYGADIFWKWKPVNHHKGFPFVTLQSEFLFRGYEAAAATVEVEDPSSGGHMDVNLPGETLWDWGAYVQVSYGFHEGWVASLRGDYSAPITNGKYESMLGEDDASRSERFRVSPALTWYPSEFSRVRLQYNYDHGDSFGSAHSVWLQLEFLLGSHGDHHF